MLAHGGGGDCHLLIIPLGGGPLSPWTVQGHWLIVCVLGKLIFACGVLFLHALGEHLMQRACSVWPDHAAVDYLVAWL